MEIPAPHRHDILVTGLPRSGTTLLCHLLNKVPDTVALHEPLDMSRVAKLETPSAIADEVASFCQATRTSLITRGAAFSRAIDGKVPDNNVPDAAVVASGLRQGGAEREEITFDKPLTADLLLVVKHPILFTGMLETLTARFTCFAVIRNPLAVLGSWNSVAMGVQNGHARYAEQVDPGLRASLAAIKDRIERQFFLLAWFYEKYARLLPGERIIRYEDVIASGGRALQAITPAAQALAEPLASKNASRVYPRDTQRALAERLLRSKHDSFWKFYTRESVEALLA